MKVRFVHRVKAALCLLILNCLSFSVIAANYYSNPAGGNFNAVIWSTSAVGPFTIAGSSITSGDHLFIQGGVLVLNLSNATVYSTNMTVQAGATVRTVLGAVFSGNIIVQNGGTVLLGPAGGSTGGITAQNIYINAGGKIWGNDPINSAASNMKTIRINGAQFICDGVLGDGTNNDALLIQPEGAVVTLGGSGSIDCGRIRKSAGSGTVTTLVVDANVNVRFGTTCIYNNQSNSTFNVTVNVGKALKCIAIANPIGFPGTEGSISLNGTTGLSSRRQGLYKIDGTLECENLYVAAISVISTDVFKYLVGSAGTIRIHQQLKGNSATPTTAAMAVLELQAGANLFLSGSLPTAAVDGTGTKNVFIFNNTSTVTYNGGNQTIENNFGSYGNLTIAGTLVKTLAGNTNIISNLFIQIGTVLDAGTNTLDGSAALTMTGGSLQLGKNGTILPELTGAYSLTGGLVNFKGSGTGINAQTIRAVNYFDLSSTSFGDRIFDSVGVVGIAGNFTKGTNDYTFTGSSIDYNGNANQDVIPFVAGGSFQGKTYNTLILSNGGVKQLTGLTDVEGILALKDNITLRLNTHNLQMKSSAARTANLAQVGIGAAIDYNGSGRFVVERFIPARRAWRLLAAPLYSTETQTINQAWQEGYTSNNRLLPAFGLAGYGTAITTSTAAINGFDQGSSNNSSIKYFAGGSWLTPPSTNIALNTHQGYLLFVRGDRSIVVGSQWVTPNTTTLRVTGRINYGAQPAINGSSFMVIENPFPSAINFHSINKSGTLTDKFYLWDPKLNGQAGVGAFVTFSWNGSYYDQTITSSGLAYTGNTTPLPNDGTIESGAAFIVDLGTAGTLQINEKDKVISSNAAAFGRPGGDSAENISSLRFTLKSSGAQVSDSFIVDGALVTFNEQNENDVDEYDAIKINSFSESLSIRNANQLIAIERRKPIDHTDSICIHLSNLKNRKYNLVIDAANMNHHSLVAYLEDIYLDSITALNMAGLSYYTFNVDNIPGSSNPHRFNVVFKKLGEFLNETAKVEGVLIKLTWSMTDIEDIHHFEIERSSDSLTFVKVASFLPVIGDSAFEWTDFLLSGSEQYFYRIKAVFNAHATSFSKIIQPVFFDAGNDWVAYPNPLNGRFIQLKCNSRIAGNYILKLISETGEVVTKQNILHQGGNFQEKLNIDVALVKGLYFIEITAPDGEKKLMKIINL